MILASTPASTPDGGTPDPDLVTPGTIGFLATLAVVILTIFLIRDALRRVRRLRARSGASDAYPIPLRRHVVPNQSTLSGPETPESESADTESGGENETDADSESGGDAAPEPDGDRATESDTDSVTGADTTDRRGGSSEESTDSSESSDRRS